MQPAVCPLRETAVPARWRAAFTLIELLVVSAIIAILAALLMPALARAKDQARRIRCISNEKQMTIAWTLYPTDNQEALVLNGGRQTGSTFRPGIDQPFLWAYGGNHGDPQTLTNRDYLTSPKYALLANYIKAVEIFKCPADRVQWPIGSGKYFELRSYTMNSYIGTPGSQMERPLLLHAAFRTYMKSPDLASDLPASRFLFIDGNPQSICTPGFGVDFGDETFIHYPSTLHKHSGVLAFADGHVEVRKWLDSRTKPATPTSSISYISHYATSYRNADLLWLRERTTRRK